MTEEPQEGSRRPVPGTASSGEGRFTAPLGVARHLTIPTVRLDAVPVLDLCVIALLFSLVFTRFVIVPGVRVDLPDSAMATQHSPTGVAVLTIQNEGMLFFDGGVYEVASVERGFRSYVERSRADRPVLLVKVQADFSMEAFLRICELARATGFTEIQVAAERPAEDAGSQSGDLSVGGGPERLEPER